MRQINKIVCMIFAVSMLAMFEGISVADSSISIAQEKAITFIENVLPLEISQYNITLRVYGVPDLPDIGSTQPEIFKQEIVTYTLENKDSTVDVICTIQNDVLSSCNVYVNEGSIISGQSYSSVIEATTAFLQRYQDYANLDSSNMIAMLSNIDSAKNATVTLGNLKLTVIHKDLSDTIFGDSIIFRWVLTYNGCEYKQIEVRFRDGVFSGFNDARKLYRIGDTSVNVSREEAIKIAVDAIQNYSYRMSDDWVVTEFDVVEEKAEAHLQPSRKEDNILYPVWSVTLPLNGTWPGSVRELLVHVWAGTGEVDFVHHQAYGDFPLEDAQNFEPQVTSPTSQEETRETAIYLLVLAVVTAVTIAAAAIIVRAIRKMRKTA